MVSFGDWMNCDAPTRREVLKSASAAAGLLVLPAFMSAGAQAQAAAGGTLKVVPQADLRILDPVWTTAQITANHGYMVYDNLFALDSEFQPQPQMVAEHETSEDGKTYRFTLREGLKWHDGSPVTARDCVASLKRWATRSAEGRVMTDRGAIYQADDERSFTLTLDEPFSMVHLAFANPVNPCFMMREQEALTDPYEQIKTVVGSGPFIFVQEEWAPGHQVVYRRNPDYVPRDEPPSGLAGGKIAKVDRVVWLYIPDSGTATNALMTGEVDMLEFPAHDLLPIISAGPDTEVKVIDSIGYQGMLRMNCLIPPFDKPEARQAALHLVQARQDEYLAAMIGVPEYQKVCLTPFVCGSPNESNVGIEQFTKDGLEDRVRGLFEKAGYAGEPIVIMDPTDQHLMHMMVLVFAQHLRDVGVTVDLQATDWGTLASRRPTKVPPSEDPSGYHVFPTWWPGFTMQNPITNIPLETTSGGKNWYGWPSDERLETLRVSYTGAQTEEERQKVVDAIQARFFEVVPYIYVGQFYRPVAYRKDRVTGVIGQQSPVFWNIDMTTA
jgi:peptide/nickel transport system substrate-binding protein